MSHEDVRRSLEVLDSVLAEFDDCLEAWDNIGQDNDVDRSYNLKHNAVDSPDDNVSTASFTYDTQSIDGDTSHDSGLSLQEQTKISSPPPIPKRSVTTKLSDRSSGLFNFNQLDDNQSCDSFHSECSTLDNYAILSENNAINTLSTKDDEVFKQNHCCEKCGGEIGSSSPVVGQDMDKDVSFSPFSQRRKMFEDRANESPQLDRPLNGSSFKIRAEVIKDPDSGLSSLNSCRSLENGRSDASQPSFTSKYSPKVTKVPPPTVGGLLPFPNSPNHTPDCKCKERLQKLQLKFAETIRLLKANKIKGLDKKPPSFVPPPPPEVILKNIRNGTQNSNNLKSDDLPKSPLVKEPKDYLSANNSLNSRLQEDGSGNLVHLQNSEKILQNEKYIRQNFQNGSCVEDLRKNFQNDSYVEDPKKNFQNGSYMGDSKKVLQNRSYSGQKLCKRCSKSTEILTLCETIEDIPKLLPTDALNRPHLGLSYSMEDDLSPGVKEILQPSPRNTTPLTRKTKTTSLSTFSLSDTSLGYVSSQSDFERSYSPMTLDKVPVSTLKYSTLPEGMTLNSLPSYYGHNQSPKLYDQKSQHPMFRDSNFNQTSDPQLRSSSASPLPEPEKPQKKSIFRGFSRKNKDKKNKNGEIKNNELVRGMAS